MIFLLYLICYLLTACLEYLELMINNFGTSICQPNITVVCKEISKNIGDRDNHVRTAALNWFVAVFLVHGDAVFSLAGNVYILYIYI